MLKKILFSLLVCLPTSLICKHLNIKNLTLDQKIGQLFMVAAVANEEIAKDFLKNKSYRMDKKYIEELIRTYHIGGIIYLGKSDEEKQIKRTAFFQSISTIPLLIGQDLEPGRVGASRLPGSFIFPDNKTIGSLNDLEETYNIAFTIGKQCKKLGVHINFAPVADIDSNPLNPVINNRSFSNDKEIVAQHAIVFAQGLHDAGIIACAKHFPGHGDTNIDSHYDLPIVAHNRTRLDAIELYPFKALIAHNIPTIMIAHLYVPDLEPEQNMPASLSKTIVTHLLQKELEFAGLIITDGLDMQAITKNYSDGQAELLALCAGNDILLCPFDVPAAAQAIKQAIIDGMITEQEIDAHVEKILRIKQEYIKI